MVSIKLKYIIKQTDSIKLLLRGYNKVKRYAYNRFVDANKMDKKTDEPLCDKPTYKSIKQEMDNINELRTHLINCAIRDAKAKYQRHKDKPNIVFGSKKNLKKRVEGEITNEQWKEYRLTPIMI